MTLLLIGWLGTRWSVGGNAGAVPIQESTDSVGTITTVHGGWFTQAWLTEPNTRLWCRCPTTSMAAPRAAFESSAHGDPSTTSVSTATGGSPAMARSRTTSFT